MLGEREKAALTDIGKTLAGLDHAGQETAAAIIGAYAAGKAAGKAEAAKEATEPTQADT